jgi:parallel beta-helix repeat protein
MKRNIIAFLILLFSVDAFAQLSNIKDSPTLFDNIVPGVTNIARRSYLDDNIFQRFIELRNAMRKRAYGTSDYTSLSTAVTAASDDTANLNLDSQIVISSNTTISGTVAVFATAEARVEIGSGDTLTISPSFFAPKEQIFYLTDSTSQVVFGPKAVDVVYAEWFGAKGDNSTDDWEPIMAAIESIYQIGDTNELGTGVAGGIVQLLEGIYRVGKPVFVPGHVWLRGVGKFATGLAVLTSSTDMTVVYNVDISGGASPDTTAQNYALLSDMYIIGTDTASATQPTVLWGASFTKIWNVNIQAGDTNLLFHSGRDSYFEELHLISARNYNIHIPDSLNGVEVSSVQIAFTNIKAIGAGTYSFWLEADFNQSGAGGGNRIFLKHIEISQVGGIGVFADHMGEVFIDDTDVSGSTGIHTAFKIWNCWKPRINRCEAEMGGSSGRISVNGGAVAVGFHLLDQTAGFMFQNVSSVSDTGGVGLLLENSNENRITDNTFSADTIGIWIRGSISNTIKGNVMTNQDPDRGGFGVLEEASSNYNQGSHNYVKHLQDTDIITYQLANGSNWKDNYESDDTSGLVRIPFMTGEGRMRALDDGDTTPEVDAGSLYRANNTSLTTITDFDGEFGFGKIIHIFHLNGNTKYDVTGSNLTHVLNTDFTADSGTMISWIKNDQDQKWVCMQADTL